MTNHNIAPRVPLGSTQAADLAHALTHDVLGVRFEFGQLGEFIARADDFDIDPRAVVIARERLTAAAERGNSTAAAILARLDGEDS